MAGQIRSVIAGEGRHRVRLRCRHEEGRGRDGRDHPITAGQPRGHHTQHRIASHAWKLRPTQRSARTAGNGRSAPSHMITCRRSVCRTRCWPEPVARGADGASGSRSGRGHPRPALGGRPGRGGPSSTSRAAPPPRTGSVPASASGAFARDAAAHARRSIPISGRWPACSTWTQASSPGSPTCSRWTRRVDSAPLHHYRWRTLPKRGGVRLVAVPKPRLKEMQRRVLRHVIAPIPGTPGRARLRPGPIGALRCRRHAGSTVVIRRDVESFFASIAAARVGGVLRRAGLPAEVARTVTGLVHDGHAVRACGARCRRPRITPRISGWVGSLATPHLPTGAPTSPALANLVAFSLDRRLAGLADLVRRPVHALRRRPAVQRRLAPAQRAQPPSSARSSRSSTSEGFRAGDAQDRRARRGRSPAGARRGRERSPDARPP